MSAWWIVEQTDNARFPWRIRIEQDGRALLCVRAQDRWPGAGRQVFCLRELEAPEAPFAEVERVPVRHLARLGRKLSVTLDRAQRKRCEFLRLEKQRKDGSGSYEQIFFRTEQALRQHRSAKRAELTVTDAIDVLIDSRERYPWRFPGARITRRALPVGDYALSVGDRLIAIVERKTRANLLHDFAELKGLQQQLAELAAWPHAALVVEAQYADFSNPRHIDPWPAAHLQRVLGELPALFPGVQLVFAGNRKLANLWTQRYLAACAARLQQGQPDLLREASAGYRAQTGAQGLDTRIRIAALTELPDGFPVGLLRQQFPGAPPARIKRVLDQLRREGRVEARGHGRGAQTGIRPAQLQGHAAALPARRPRVAGVSGARRPRRHPRRRHGTRQDRPGAGASRRRKKRAPPASSRARRRADLAGRQLGR